MSYLGVNYEAIKLVCEQAMARAAEEFRSEPANQATADRMAEWMRRWCVEQGVYAAVSAIVDVGGPPGYTFKFYPFVSIGSVRLRAVVSK